MLYLFHWILWDSNGACSLIYFKFSCHVQSSNDVLSVAFSGNFQASWIAGFTVSMNNVQIIFTAAILQLSGYIMYLHLRISDTYEFLLRQVCNSLRPKKP